MNESELKSDASFIEQMKERFLSITVEVSKLSLKPTDTLVLTIPYTLSNERAEQIHQFIVRETGHKRVMITHKDSVFSIIEGEAECVPAA